MSGFQRAVKTSAKARIGLYGVSGSGKTMTALRIARALVGPDGKIALLDTEGGSASKYADLYDFDTVTMRKPFHPDRFGKALDAAVAAGYDVFVCDGASPFWDGDGGVMAIVDEDKKRGGGWAKGTPAHNLLVDALLMSPIHVIVTMRAKNEVVIEKDDRGRTTIKKVGVKPIQRDTLEYEFDLVLYLDTDNSATVEKSRQPNVIGDRIDADHSGGTSPISEWAVGFKAWLDEGPAPEPRPAAPAPPTEAAAPPPPAAAPLVPAPAEPLASPAAPTPETASEGVSEARRATRARVSASLARLGTLDPSRDWQDMIRQKLPEFFPGKTAEPELTDAEAENLADRLDATIKSFEDAAVAK
jgi:AAA domain